MVGGSAVRRNGVTVKRTVRGMRAGEWFALVLLATTLFATWWTDLRPVNASSATLVPLASGQAVVNSGSVTTDAPDPIDTIYPGAGVHTRLTLEADPAKVRRELQMVRAMGASWIVEYFPWLYLQPKGPNDYDWTHADLVVREARAQGLQVIARIDGVPDWARPPGTTWKYLDASAYPAYARMVAAFAARYSDSVGRIIVWNEPNLSLEWGGRKVDPAGYAAMLRAVYPVVKAANPRVEVIAAGLAPNVNTDTATSGLNDIAYLSRLYDAGAAPYFDSLAMHAYGGTQPPDTTPGLDARVFRHVEKERELMEARGDGAKAVYITEGGWNDSPQYDGSVRPADRVRYTVAAYRYTQAHWPWAVAVALWEFRLPEATNSPQDNWTFVTPDFLAKPVYDEVRKALRNGR